MILEIFKEFYRLGVNITRGLFGFIPVLLIVNYLKLPTYLSLLYIVCATCYYFEIGFIIPYIKNDDEPAYKHYKVEAHIED